MQLFALDSEKKLVFAEHAAKQQNYFCVECETIVRVRSGPHRQTHYYHLAPSPDCRQNGKSMAHLQTQLFLFDLFPENDVQLEMRFPEINRIADVVWLPHKLIFEVQCSPITAAEVLERNRDYKSLGYTVVWLFHDSRFNQWRMSAAEQAVRNAPHYFTNINAEGEGFIYDQFDVEHQGIRKHKSHKLCVGIHEPHFLKSNKDKEGDEKDKEVSDNVWHKKDRQKHDKQNTDKTQSGAMPRLIEARFQLWPFHFSGDLIDYALFPHVYADAEKLLDKALTAENKLLGSSKGTDSNPSIYDKIKKWLWLGIVRPYRLFFQIILERACK